MIEAKVYNQKGEEKEIIKLDEKFFGLVWPADLVYQVITAMQANSRVKRAVVKDRSAVRGGGKKPWRQKGTGRARHGSTRSPIWIGGGVTHGPTSLRDYGQKLNKKSKTKALLALLSKKLKDNELLFIDKFDFTSAKTSLANQYLNNLAKISGFEKIAYKLGRRALIVVPKNDEVLYRSFRNIGSAKVITASDLNPLDLITFKYTVIVLPEESIKTITARVKLSTKEKKPTLINKTKDSKIKTVKTVKKELTTVK